MEAGSGEAAPGEHAAAAPGRARQGPLYQRLPRGPHRLDRRAVEQHQRLRIQGAMVQAVAGSGFQEVSVRQVIALAGVSRRSFYEQFASKQDCFLATFDLIARQQLAVARHACSLASGGPDRRMEAVLGSCAESVADDREAAALVLLEALSLGPAGARRMRAAAAAWERLIAGSLTGTALLPTPCGAAPGALLGGLHGIMAARLRDASPPSRGLLAEELCWWALAPKMPSRAAEARRLSAALRAGDRRTAIVAAKDKLERGQPPGNDRDRLLLAALRLAAREPVGLLSAARIADEAALPLEAFFELFADRDECLRLAMADAGEQLLTIAETAAERGPDWPGALAETLPALMRHFAAHPLHARALTVVAAGSGATCRRYAAQLEADLARALGAGFPDRGEAAGRALVGSLWHLVRCHLGDRRIRRLPAAARHLTLLALAPAIGADAAADTLLRAPSCSGRG